MNPLDRVSHRIRGSISRLSARTVIKWEGVFYLYLAAIFTLFIVADATVIRFTGNMRQAAFDMMMRHRIIVPKPDPDIVIIDINEASLSAMAKEYGRWPWPRQVLGEFLEHLEEQHPKAVVFDILFSDPDVFNPDSDLYFDNAVSNSTNTFFPMLRLDAKNDALSQISPTMIPGVVPATEGAKNAATIGIILPHFQSVLKGGRLGLHNIYPDADGIVREYLVYGNDYGWKIPSLPARVARELGYQEPVAQRILLNWRGKPFTYRLATFSDVFDDMLLREKKRPQNEFTDKIVLIGSTAPSLFDVKPTPLSRLHPGVEILATAIDNFKQGDFLRYPEGRFIYPLLTLLMVWATALAFYRNVGRDKIDRLFGTSQFIMLAISYASINFTTTYINLTGPFAVGLAFFTVARIYATAVSSVLGTQTLRASTRGGEGGLNAFLLLIHVDDPDRAVSEGTLKKICRDLEESGAETKSVDMLKGRQEGIWALFEHVLVVSWVFEASDLTTHDRMAKDVERTTTSLQEMLPRFLPDAKAVTWFVHEGELPRGRAARAAWRVLFAEAQVRWHKTTIHNQYGDNKS